MDLYLTLAIAIVLFLGVAWLVSEWIVRARVGRVDRDGEAEG